jgi:hypothetical protein
LLTPRYSWNIAKVGVKHQSMNQSLVSWTNMMNIYLVIINSNSLPLVLIKTTFIFIHGMEYCWYKLALRWYYSWNQRLVLSLTLMLIAMKWKTVAIAYHRVYIFVHEAKKPLTVWVRIRSSEVYSIKHYVIQFVSDLQQVGGFLRFPPTTKLTATILLKYCWKWR